MHFLSLKRRDILVSKLLWFAEILYQFHGRSAKAQTDLGPLQSHLQWGQSHNSDSLTRTNKQAIHRGYLTICTLPVTHLESAHYKNMPIQIYWKFYHNKWKISDNNADIFQISAQNIDCGYSLEPPRRGDSNEYLQSMFLSRNKKNKVYPCKLQFYYIKVGFKGVMVLWWDLSSDRK